MGQKPSTVGLQRFIAALPAIVALLAASVLFPPFTHGWGCKPTLATVSLVLVWLLPVLGGIRSAVARQIEKPVVIVSYVLAVVAVGLALQGGIAEAITAQACR